MTNMVMFPIKSSEDKPFPRRFHRWVVIFGGLVFVLSLVAEVAWAAGNSGLPLPRFVSLRKDQVNVRTGPGLRYPVDWVFIYKNMPVEILTEFKSWRKVRDWKGTTGWVHRSMLSGKNRWVIVRTKSAPLRQSASPDAPIVAKLRNKVVGRLVVCRNDWCEVTVNGIQGWTKRSALWGIYPNEKN